MASELGGLAAGVPVGSDGRGDEIREADRWAMIRDDERLLT